MRIDKPKVGTPRLTSLSRVLTLLEAVIAEGGARSITAIARDIGMPVATAHRQAMSLVEEGYLARLRRGCHVAGPRLLRLLGQLNEKQVIANAAAPVLHRLASDLDCVVQLGTLEGDMVTYRIKTGEGAGDLFTKVGMQLEAYCSGIGKVLLAALPERDREEYLATGPFPALTDGRLPIRLHCGRNWPGSGNRDLPSMTAKWPRGWPALPCRCARLTVGYWRRSRHRDEPKKPVRSPQRALSSGCVPQSQRSKAVWQSC